MYTGLLLKIIELNLLFCHALNFNFKSFSRFHIHAHHGIGISGLRWENAHLFMLLLLIGCYIETDSNIILSQVLIEWIFFTINYQSIKGIFNQLDNKSINLLICMCMCIVLKFKFKFYLFLLTSYLWKSPESALRVPTSGWTLMRAIHKKTFWVN